MNLGVFIDLVDQSNHVKQDAEDEKPTFQFWINTQQTTLFVKANDDPLHAKKLGWTSNRFVTKNVQDKQKNK